MNLRGSKMQENYIFSLYTEKPQRTEPYLEMCELQISRSEVT